MIAHENFAVPLRRRMLSVRHGNRSSLGTFGLPTVSLSPLFVVLTPNAPASPLDTALTQNTPGVACPALSPGNLRAGCRLRFGRRASALCLVFSCFSGLFVAFSKLKSCVFKKIQPLFAKRRGWGVPRRISSMESTIYRLAASRHVAVLLAAILL